jgi:hypothetical protein
MVSMQVLGMSLGRVVFSIIGPDLIPHYLHIGMVTMNVLGRSLGRVGFGKTKPDLIPHYLLTVSTPTHNLNHSLTDLKMIKTCILENICKF